MAYDETPRKPIEIRDDSKTGYACADVMIDRAKNADRYGVRTDAAAEGVGYLGVDHLDRIRRRKLK
jgi:hypothetical protein